MDSLFIADLPPPPSGKRGWPWTEDTTRITTQMSNGQPWPQLTIVTPSYNQGHYLEEAIRSVLLQGYPRLQYIVIDGGSADSTVSLIRKYERWISFWVSEKDRGQGDAINKGFSHATGEMVSWLNSDDAYFPGALRAASEAMFVQFPEAAAIYGKTAVYDAGDTFSGNLQGEAMKFSEMAVDLTKVFPTPSSFFRHSAVRSAGALDNDLHFTLDWDYWLRIGLVGSIEFVDQVWTKFRLYDSSKTGRCDVRAHEEVIALNERFWRRPNLPQALHTRRSTALMRLHTKYARRFWGDGETSRFRREMWRALRADWRVVLDPQWRRMLPHAMVGAQGAQRLVPIKRLLTGRPRSEGKNSSAH